MTPTGQDSVRRFRVFISSPGDVNKERALVIDLLKELEDDPLFERNIHLDIVAWDKQGTSVPMYVGMTPQEAINKGLPLPSACDIVIVILWSRMGTPLPAEFVKENGSAYKSGTEWEYCDALKGCRGKQPTVILYRRMEPVLFNPGDPAMLEKFQQYSLVNDFFNSFTNVDGSLNSGYNQYKDLDEFKDIFRQHSRATIHRLLRPTASSEEFHAPQPELPKPHYHHNLPNRIYSLYGSLLGRDADQERIRQALCSRYPLISIEGMGGIGKSSLALEVANSYLPGSEQAKAQSIKFDYIVWISAKDKPEQKLWLDDVLNMIARVMDFFAITQKPLSEDKKFDITQLLRSRCTLLIVDNFETIYDRSLEAWLEQVPLPSKVVVTSRRRQFRMSMPIDLDGLEEQNALILIRRHTETFNIDFLHQKSDKELLPLVINTAGNPLAIVWSLGTLQTGTLSFDDLIKDLEANYTNKNVNKTIEYLFLKTWDTLTDYAQQVLSAVPLFVGIDSICKDALCATTGLSNDEFNNAIDQLIEFKLLQPELHNEKVRYKVHPLTHTFARAKLNQRRDFETAARKRWNNYFLDFIKKNIIRDQPDRRYWNVLVSDRMQVIDQEWPSINELIQWADKTKRDTLFLNLVMLLVHYMDSRFLNLLRMDYVRKAVDIARKKNQQEDEALLRLDALGWTLVEEDKLTAAYEEIKRGFDIANQLDDQNAVKKDLVSLGYAWQARVKIEMNDPTQACRLIDEALQLSANCSSWIKSRIYMAAGDIALKQNRSKDALAYYQDQVVSMREYGGEGNGYQVEPRLGLAYVGTGDLTKAEEKFNALRVNKNIPIGKHYGDYGLALVAYKRNQKEEARRLANETREALSRKTASNILLKLINELYQEMEAESAVEVTYQN